jgi:sarcosine oxidase, subunit beta
MSPRSFEAVVVGAGIAGSALALELARRGVEVALVDRGGVCAGSSGLNAGGIRTQFGEEANIRNAARTVDRVSTFREEFGEDIAFRRAGYLLLYGSPEREEVARQAVARQNACDLPSRIVKPAEAQAILPALAVDDIAGAAYSPSDGYVDPRATTTAFARAARRAGATVLEDWDAVEIETGGDRVLAVRSAHLDVLVNAAGTWAPRLARTVGDRLPIRGRRAQAFFFDGRLRDGGLTPLTIDHEQGIYLHTEGRGFLVGTSETTEWEDPPWTVEPEPGWVGEVSRRLAHRVPELGPARFVYAWAGLLECTPDNNPLVGWGSFQNLYTVAGFSGHGMCLAPGVAAPAAQEITGGPAHPDLELYRLDRFDRGTSRAEGVWTGSHDYGFGTHGGPWRTTDG